VRRRNCVVESVRRRCRKSLRIAENAMSARQMSRRIVCVSQPMKKKVFLRIKSQLEPCLIFNEYGVTLDISVKAAKDNVFSLK
jgi:hypothetical protein